jgi:putative ABC transport system permease protein
MALWRQLIRGVRALARRAETDRELDDEVQDYLERAAAAHVGGGRTHDEAMRLARRELGGTTVVREQMRSVGWENAVDALAGDIRYALRQLRASPGFTVVTVLTLALGLGATTAIFSAVDPILFEPLPYPDAGRVATIWEVRPDGSHGDGTFGMARSLAERTRSFEVVAAFKPWQPNFVTPGLPERLEGQRVGAGYFRALGIAPALGRDLIAADDRAGGPNVVILSDGLWRRRLGADPAVLGRRITLGDDAFTIVGVMPAGFENVLAPKAEVWAPLQYDLSQGRAWGHHLNLVGRLRQGVTYDQAARELGVLGQRVIDAQRPQTYGRDVRFSVTSLQQEIARGVRPALLAVLGAVVLVLLIACVNVTNLLLARGLHRRGELALRAALGAGRGRLVRQLLTESIVLAGVGGIVGTGFALLGVRALVALGPEGLPRIGAIRVDGTVLAFAAAITTLVGVAFGMIPALHAARSDLHGDLQVGPRRAAGGHRRTRSALVVAEVALALVLLVSSGLLLRSLQRLFAVRSGFDPEQVLTMQVQTSGQRYRDDSTTYRFFERMLEAARRVPGVVSAGLSSQLPLSGDLDLYGVHFEWNPGQRPEDDRSAFRYAVSPGYIETMRIPLRRGRSLREHDDAAAPLVALINESFAARVFAGADPIGQRLRVGPDAGPAYTIVGVVGDVKQASLATAKTEAVYVTPSQWHFADNVMSLVVRTRGDASAMAPAIREAVWSVDKALPVARVATMDDLVAASAGERRFALVIFEAFALSALVLAAAGIYGVLAGSVAERTREIGVRAALGATRRSIVGLVVRQGLTLTALGVALGLAGAVAASQWLVAMLFGVSHLDPLTYGSVVLLLGLVALIACGVPAWRAAQVDPARTLRE